MDLSLNADAALRAYLPPESWNGEAQHRFIFRTEDGDEEPLLARLAVVRPSMVHGRFEHWVLLRPENAETARIFAVQGYWHRGNSWMTPHGARRFRWWLFEHNLRGNEHRAHLSRFWVNHEEKRDIRLRLDSYGWGGIYVCDEEERKFDSQSFIWDRDTQGAYDQLDLRFLRQTDASFQSEMNALWNNPLGEIKTTLRWQEMNDAERDALAFRCQNGSWDDLRRIASLALQVRLARVNASWSEIYKWQFTDIDGIYVRGANLYSDEFLLRWRLALVEVFVPDNINAGGNMIAERPLCIWSHIDDSELKWVIVDSPSHHELVEAHLKLREWAVANFSPDEAERLLAL